MRYASDDVAVDLTQDPYRLRDIRSRWRLPLAAIARIIPTTTGAVDRFEVDGRVCGCGTQRAVDQVQRRLVHLYDAMARTQNELWAI